MPRKKRKLIPIYDISELSVQLKQEIINKTIDFRIKMMREAIEEEKNGKDKNSLLL